MNVNIIISREEISKLPHKLQVIFAIFCAKQVFHFVEEKDKEVCLRAIEVAIAFTENRATKEDCANAANAAAYAANAATAAAYATVNAATAAAYATVNAANAAAYTANAANATAAAYTTANATAYAEREAIIKAQFTYYDELLSFVDGRVDNLILE